VGIYTVSLPEVHPGGYIHCCTPGGTPCGIYTVVHPEVHPGSDTPLYTLRYTLVVYMPPYHILRYTLVVYASLYTLRYTLVVYASLLLCRWSSLVCLLSFPVSLLVSTLACCQ